MKPTKKQMEQVSEKLADLFMNDLIEIYKKYGKKETKKIINKMGFMKKTDQEDFLKYLKAIKKIQKIKLPVK